MKDNFEKYYKAIDYLESIANISQPDYMSLKRGRSLFLKRFEYFLKLVGNPHQNLKYIHVGGTSGKGSVVNMIQSILTEAGYKTGQYTSPFPTTTIEKYKVDDKLIAPDEFARILEQIKPAIDQCYKKSTYGRPSYFEICTAIAFIYFKQKKCDYVVLEVGLGGRYDATNIIKKAEATVINLIDYDHTQILGETLIKIAKEKAAIIKPKTVFFTTDQNNKRVLDIFKAACQKNKAEFNIVKLPEKEYKLKLLGQHQQNNTQLAARVCQHLGVSLTKIKNGLSKVKLSCRSEIIQKNPLVILDGAHNPSKMKTTLETIKNLTYQRLYLIIALTKTKKPKETFKNIQFIADKVFITRYQTSERKCYPPLELAKRIKSKKPTKIYLDAFSALDDALGQAKKNDLILVTGSFYLAGELRKQWRSEYKILKKRTI